MPAPPRGWLHAGDVVGQVSPVEHQRKAITGHFRRRLSQRPNPIERVQTKGGDLPPLLQPKGVIRERGEITGLVVLHIDTYRSATSDRHRDHPPGMG